MNTQNEALNQFIIETVLIDPIQKIVNQLNDKSFRDCDIKWLNNKMENFIKFAAETLNIKMDAFAPSESYATFNTFVYNYYTERFTTLLVYFKSL